MQRGFTCGVTVLIMLIVILVSVRSNEVFHYCTLDFRENFFAPVGIHA
jgi:hypothetical protein